MIFAILNVILFDDTIKANISYAKSDASDDEIFEACKFAAADEFINKLPESYETIIGEKNLFKINLKDQF